MKMKKQNKEKNMQKKTQKSIFPKASDHKNIDWVSWEQEKHWIQLKCNEQKI